MSNRVWGLLLGALLGGAVLMPAVAAELNFDRKTVIQLMATCKQAKTPLTTNECEHYIRGLAQGWCIAKQDNTEDLKTCMAVKVGEIRQTTQALAKEKQQREAAP